MSSEEVFEYEITVPATVVKIRLPKQYIFDALEDIFERPLSNEEKKEVWERFSTHDDFWGIFPGEAWKHGVNMYGASDSTTYSEIFKADVEESMQTTIDGLMKEMWREELFPNVMDDVITYLDTKAKDVEKEEKRMDTTSPPSPTAAVAPENENQYIEYLKEQHPIIKAANPTWTPQQIIVAIGHQWSLIHMTIGIEKKSGNIVIKHKTGRISIDSCGKAEELKSYLEAYRVNHGHEALFDLAERIAIGT